MKKNYNSVYGPVNSWRYGKSLGIDVICDESTCSFNCIYCQLGNILHLISERKIFISTKQVIEDFKKSLWHQAEIITFSGSGEPTLALNIGEIINEIKLITKIPVLILTNATLLNDKNVIKDLSNADKISVKLDASSDKVLNRINRPAKDIDINQILKGIKNFRKHFQGKLSIQTMIIPANLSEIDKLINLIKEISPDELELNTPTREYPLEWDIENRGRSPSSIEKITLKKLSESEMYNLVEKFNKNMDIPIITPYLH